MPDLSPTPVPAAGLPTVAGTGPTPNSWTILRCDAHRDWMLDLDADCPDPCDACTYLPVFELEVPMVRDARNGLPVPPLTANQRLHFQVRALRTRTIREAVMVAAKAAKIPAGRHLTVGLHYAPGDNRRRDADNLMPTLKAACDALARGKRRDWVGLELVPDDTPEHMTKQMPEIHPGPGERRLWLTVEVQR